MWALRTHREWELTFFLFFLRWKQLRAEMNTRMDTIKVGDQCLHLDMHGERHTIVLKTTQLGWETGVHACNSSRQETGIAHAYCGVCSSGNIVVIMVVSLMPLQHHGGGRDSKCSSVLVTHQLVTMNRMEFTSVKIIDSSTGSGNSIVIKMIKSGKMFPQAHLLEIYMLLENIQRAVHQGACIKIKKVRKPPINLFEYI
jgi:hypothetical protein